MPIETQRLFDVLSAIHPLSEELKSSIRRELTFLSLPKGYPLLEAPRIADLAYFIVEGFAMSYMYIRGKRHVECFWGPGQIIVSAKSFFEQTPSKESIRLMIQSDILCLSYSSVMHLIRDFPETSYITRVIVNQYLESCRERLHDRQYASSEERFNKLLATFPTIEQSVNQEHIASYLGITPQSMSRLKRRKR
jgi:CRP-like cAMP-binding protein